MSLANDLNKIDTDLKQVKTDTNTALSEKGSAGVSTLSELPEAIRNIPSSSYTLPVATADALGGVKVGENLSITPEGVLSSTGGEKPWRTIQKITLSEDTRFLYFDKDKDNQSFSLTELQFIILSVGASTNKDEAYLKITRNGRLTYNKIADIRTGIRRPGSKATIVCRVEQANKMCNTYMAKADSDITDSNFNIDNYKIMSETSFNFSNYTKITSIGIGNTDGGDAPVLGKGSRIGVYGR